MVVLDRLCKHIKSHKLNNICIAFSGGLDSTVLLHASAQLQKLQKINQLRAIHINHQLSNQAELWAEHAQKICAELEVPISVFTVKPLKSDGGIEASARNERYKIFAEQLKNYETLFTAHHQQDQAETVLLQLFRGAGPNGLAAMPELKPLGKGQLSRPLLSISPKSIKNYAEFHKLAWIEDPSNQQLNFDRNFIRHNILPKLAARYPGLLQNINRSAEHCAELTEWQQTEIQEKLAKCCQADVSLNLDFLLQESLVVQKQILRAWYKQNIGQYPSSKLLEEILNTCVHANKDANPKLKAENKVIRRYQNLLYLLEQEQNLNLKKCYQWHDLSSPLKISGIGELSIKQPDLFEGKNITVRFREGGEKIQLASSTNHQSLKNFFQQNKIPPWQRQRIPLVFCEEKLIAIPNLWFCSEYSPIKQKVALVAK